MRSRTGAGRRCRPRRPRFETPSARAISTMSSKTARASDADQGHNARAPINPRLQQLLREASLKWGVEIDSVEIKDVDIPEQMQRAIAKEEEVLSEKQRLISTAGAD